MVAPIALQLYTVREAMQKDASGVLQRVADIGYVGVEGGLVDKGSGQKTDAVHRYTSMGFQVPSVMTGFPFDDTKIAALDDVAALGCKFVGISWYPPDKLKTVDGVRVLADKLNEADDIVRPHGLTFFYHNHWAEGEKLPDGRTPLDILMENTNSTVNFELDVYWAQTGGSDPVAIVKKYKERIPLLHIKDGPALPTQRMPMVAVGEGNVDIAGVIAAGADTTQWLIVELDECATDMLEAVEKSYRYLVSNGLGRGNKS